MTMTKVKGAVDNFGMSLLNGRCCFWEIGQVVQGRLLYCWNQLANPLESGLSQEKLKFRKTDFEGPDGCGRWSPCGEFQTGGLQQRMICLWADLTRGGETLSTEWQARQDGRPGSQARWRRSTWSVLIGTEIADRIVQALWSFRDVE